MEIIKKMCICLPFFISWTVFSGMIMELTQQNDRLSERERQKYDNFTSYKDNYFLRLTNVNKFKRELGDNVSRLCKLYIQYALRELSLPTTQELTVAILENRTQDLSNYIRIEEFTLATKEISSKAMWKNTKEKQEGTIAGQSGFYPEENIASLINKNFLDKEKLLFFVNLITTTLASLVDIEKNWDHITGEETEGLDPMATKGYYWRMTFLRSSFNRILEDSVKKGERINEAHMKLIENLINFFNKKIAKKDDNIFIPYLKNAQKFIEDKKRWKKINQENWRTLLQPFVIVGWIKQKTEGFQPEEEESSTATEEEFLYHPTIKKEKTFDIPWKKIMFGGLLAASPLIIWLLYKYKTGYKK